HREDGFLCQRLSFLHGEAAAQFKNESGDIDFARTNLGTVAALQAQALNLVRRLQRVEPRGENGADAARIYLAKDVPANQAKNRTDVQARSAANALQRLLEFRIFRHFGAAIVHQDDVQLFRSAIGV